MTAWAHALWIETASVGQKGQKQSIRIIYAEPGEAPEKLQDWYADKLRITVHSPSGWNKEIITNAEGVAEFTPIWPGTYRIEASKTEKETGEQGDKTYQSVWRCATYILDVSK
jgi:protocatechuate 3,4-dioxygenase beta subunit